MTAAFDRLPIRTRLAGVSALLTFTILCAFAIAIGSLTVRRIRSDFYRGVESTAQQLPSELNISVNPQTYRIEAPEPPLADLVEPEQQAAIRVLTLGGATVEQAPSGAPNLGAPSATPHVVNGYLVVSRTTIIHVAGSGAPIGRVFVQYGRSLAQTEATAARVELFLIVGVFAGAGLALLAGVAIARRAMAPIAELTGAAAEIARTRDPSGTVPQPAADDEVAELARTLEGMLRELDAARGETEAMLARQRRFVADASHELRTPLTSVLANLELLADSLHGDQGDAARSALRSSRRMRRLVADLLLLARTDVGRVVAHEPCDLAQVVVEAAGELGPVSDAHDIELDIQPAPVEGARDELHRLTINLIENALRHTPPGSEIRVSTRQAGDQAELVVEDNGPGVPPELAPTLFERFVRGAGDRGGSFGLGLAIVRAVAESHGGSVRLETHHPHGARFVVDLPAAAQTLTPRQPRAEPSAAA
ncbi:MAG TPA: HAMP domain-containing sensor histidine kinase [Solirubrobacteraceae bacterium]|nr:HAMP domain-containing sensor histidine kinase [Solirubrobacteraceae bacterium]